MRQGWVMPSSALFALVFSLVLLPTSAQITSPARSEFAYVANQTSNTISGYRLNAIGILTPLPGSPFAVGQAPNSVVADPTGNFLYVADVLSNAVSGFRIDNDGALTPISGSPFATGSGPGWVTMDPEGRFLYVADCAALCSGRGSGDVFAFSIDQHTGFLTPVPGSPFRAGNIPYAVATDNLGRFAYVANFASGNVSAFSIDSQTGTLRQLPGSPFPAGRSPLALSVDPWNQFLYVANTGSGNISVFAINIDGSLSAVPGSPFSSGEFTGAVVPHVSGQYVYATIGDGVVTYRVQDRGTLLRVRSSPFPAGQGPSSLSFDPSGRFLFVTNMGGGSVSAFTLNLGSGALTPVPGSPFAAEGVPASVAVTHGAR